MGGAHGRVVGNLVRASTRRFFGAARDNGPLCIIATGPPPTVSEVRLSNRLPLPAPAEQT
jgi:hypothetical protein